MAEFVPLQHKRFKHYKNKYNVTLSPVLVRKKGIIKHDSLAIYFQIDDYVGLLALSEDEIYNLKLVLADK